MAELLGRRGYDDRSGRIIQNVMPRILLLDRNIQDAGFVVFFNRLKSRGTGQEKFIWDTDTYLPTTDVLSSAVSSTTQTTIPVTNPTYFNVNQMWVNVRSGEIVAVTAVNTATSNITVKRGATAQNSSGGTAGAAMLSGDTLARLGTFVGENSNRQTFQSTTPTEVYNYTQQFRMDLSLSERQIKRQFENDNELSFQEFKILNEFRMDFDRTHLWGERSRWTNDDGDDVTTTNGFKNIISTNTFPVNGTLYKSDLDEWLVEEGLKYGSRNKILFCGTDMILAFTQMVDSNLTFQINVAPVRGAAVGTEVLRYIAPNGRELLIMEDRNITDYFSDEGYLADMTQLERRVFSGNGRTGEMHMIRNTEDPDDPGTVHTIMADCGLAFGEEKTHGSITGVNGGAYSLPDV